MKVLIGNFKGKDAEIDLAFDKQSSNAIANSVVTEAVDQLNSNLDGLGYGENGAKNLFNPKLLLYGNYDKKTDTITLPNNANKALNMVFKENTQYTFSAYVKQSNSNTSIRFNIIYTDGTRNEDFLLSNSTTETYASKTSESGKTISEVRWTYGDNGTATFRNLQIEEGITATPYKPYIPSVKMLADEVGKQNDSLSVIGKCKNLLKPTLQTTTKNGVTCTANGDGTYTLNGTAKGQAVFTIPVEKTLKKGTKILGCINGSSTTYFITYRIGSDWSGKYDYGNGYVLQDDIIINDIAITVRDGQTVSNIIFKPMITTNLNATYDDFVPYTGDGETLTADVAELKNDLSDLKISDVAGGKNISDFDALISKMGYYDNFTKQSDGSYLFTAKQVLFKEGFVIDNISENEQYTFSFKIKCGTGTNFRFAIVYTDGTYTASNQVATSDFTVTRATSEEGKIISYLRFDWSSLGTFYIKDFLVEVGTTATDYEPYIPSVKMLAEENAQQSTAMLDVKMLGWSVPKECPIQNYVDSDGVFHQRVGRVDLGSLTWNYISSGQFFYADLAGGKIGSKNAYCSRYNLSNSSTYGGMANGEFSLSVSSETVSRVYVKDTSYTDGTAFKNAMKGVYLYYELETEQTISVDGNEAVTQIKNDLSKQCKKDGITTNETLIGTFNGKNYYRKLFTGIGASGSSITVNVGEKIEIYNYYGRAYVYGQSGTSDVKYPIPNKNYYIESQSISETSFQLTIPTSSDMRKIDLVIEYTKVDE